MLILSHAVVHVTFNSQALLYDRWHVLIKVHFVTLVKHKFILSSGFTLTLGKTTITEKFHIIFNGHNDPVGHFLDLGMKIDRKIIKNKPNQNNKQVNSRLISA